MPLVHDVSRAHSQDWGGVGVGGGGQGPQGPAGRLEVWPQDIMVRRVRCVRDTMFTVWLVT